MKNIERYKCPSRAERKQVTEIIREFKHYVNGEEIEFYTNQKVIGFGKLFRGSVVKKWVDLNEERVDYYAYNRVLIKM